MNDSPVTGFRVGEKYVLERLLGRGGNGEVWRARNDVTRGPVAIKIVAGDPDRKARGEQEAFVGANLNHRNVVRVYDAFYGQNGVFFLVMEALQGETVHQRLARQGSLALDEALSIVAAVLRGLAHAHELGVLHRDISPSNLFLANDGDGRAVPKLLDFGLAKAARATIQTSEGDVLGTPQYMAPEQVRGAKLDGRADLFVVGALLYELITGVCVFERHTPSACLAAILEDTVDPHALIPPRIWIVIQRALAKQPYERFLSANEFLDELSRAAERSIDETVSPALNVDCRDASVLSPSHAIMPPPAMLEGAVESSAAANEVTSDSLARRRKRGRRIVGAVVGASLLCALIAGIRALGADTSKVRRITLPVIAEPARTPVAPAIVPSVPPIEPEATATGPIPATPSPHAPPLTTAPRASTVISPSPRPRTSPSAAIPRPAAVATTPGF